MVVELLVHLRELRSREIVDTRQLNDVWLQLRHCDSAALDALEPPTRPLPLHRRGAPPATATGAPADRASLRLGASHLRVALHRRLMVLESVLDERTSDVTPATLTG